MKMSTVFMSLALLLISTTGLSQDLPELYEPINYGCQMYKTPSYIDHYDNGELVRVEVEREMDSDFVDNSLPIRVMFKSTGIHNEDIAATGIIFIPYKDLLDEKHIAVWAQGTVGIGDNCTSSKYASLHHSSYPYGNPAKEFVKEGYITLFVDYEGLGTEGLHPYISPESQANIILDGVKATKQLLSFFPFLNLSNKFAIMGHSQGTAGARMANILATEERMGELELVGTVETSYAIPTAEDIISTLYILDNYLGATYLAYMGQGIKAYYPEFDLSKFYGPVLMELQEEAATQCFDEFIYNLEPGPLYPNGDYLNYQYLEELEILTYLSNTVNGQDGIGSNAPVLLMNMTGDLLYTEENMITLGEQMCSNGVEVENLIIDGQDHGYPIYLDGGLPTIIDWINDRFEDIQMTTTCD